MAFSQVESRRYFDKARRYLVGGVNSPVRAFKSVGGTPVVMEKGKGPHLWDLDGNRYVDYVLSWGPLVLGHAHPAVLKAIQQAARKGTSFGACHSLELELAWLVRQAFPSMQKVRFVSSGTEATLSALRLARGVTGRDHILKFEGCYHGHADSLLVKAGSGAATLGVPDSAGVPRPVAACTLTLPYNDIQAVKRLFRKIGGQIAGVIVEPVAGNMGLVPPQSGFLETLRQETQKYGSLLIFDEVMTGFRVALGGAQEVFGIKPDLTCLGKVLGGGLPCAALGGRAEVMDFLAPLGPVYQAGTLSGNPLAMAAGIATLRHCLKPGFYRRLSETGRHLAEGWKRVFKKRKVPAQVHCLGSMFGVFFREGEVTDFSSAKGSDARLFARYFHAMLQEGVYLAPSQFESGFVSAAHGPREVGFTLRATEKALKKAAA